MRPLGRSNQRLEAAFLESPPHSRGQAFFSYLDRKRPGREISPLLGLLKMIMSRRESNVKPAKRAWKRRRVEAWMRGRSGAAVVPRSLFCRFTRLASRSRDSVRRDATKRVSAADFADVRRFQEVLICEIPVISGREFAGSSRFPTASRLQPLCPGSWLAAAGRRVEALRRVSDSSPPCPPTPWPTSVRRPGTPALHLVWGPLVSPVVTIPLSAATGLPPRSSASRGRTPGRRASSRSCLLTADQMDMVGPQAQQVQSHFKARHALAQHTHEMLAIGVVAEGGKIMRRRSSAKGRFRGCSAYPDCKGSRPMKEEPRAGLGPH